MQRVRFLIIALFCTFASNAQAGSTIVVFGDSLTAGYQIPDRDAYPAVLERALWSRGFTDAKVINMSVTGETLESAYNRVQDVVAVKPDLVLVELGINDALKGADPGTEINSRLNNLLHAMTFYKLKIILIGTRMPVEMGRVKAHDYSVIFYKHSTASALPLIPDIMAGVSGNPKLLLSDGFNPNAEGVKAMVRNTYSLIEPQVRYKQKMEEYQKKLKE